MKKETLNSITTLLPTLIFSILASIFVTSQFIILKKIGLIIVLSTFPIQGFVFLFRKKVFFKYWLSKKEKIIEGFIWIIVGIVLIIKCINGGLLKVFLYESLTQFPF